MDVPMDELPPSDSQAIQEMLEINSSPAKSINESFIRSPNPNDPTLDSFSSGKPTNSLPQYHFHGLASTQTQSQVFDDIEMDEGSQKENLVSVNSHDSAQSSGPQPPHPSAPTTTVLAKVTRATSQASSAKGTRQKQAATVSFQSPAPKASAKKATGQQIGHSKLASGSRYTPATRSLSRPSSPDSFISQLPEPKYVPSSKFNIPLSQLLNSSAVSGEPEDEGDSMDASNHRRERVESGRGRILVESTPSQSSDEERSQHVHAHGQDEDSFESHRGTDAPPNEGDRSDPEPSPPDASYARMLEGGPQYEATQPSTQPATQVDDTSDLPNFTGTTGTGRSLFGMIPPEKIHRYKGYIQTPAESPVESRLLSHPPVFVETQPSEDSDPAPQPSPAYPVRNVSELAAHRASPEPPLSDPPYAVVPDSEPARGSSPPPIPRVSPSPPPAAPPPPPAQPRKSPQKPEREHTPKVSRPVPPTSEAEEEVPLVRLTKGQPIRKQVKRTKGKGKAKEVGLTKRKNEAEAEPNQKDSVPSVAPTTRRNQKAVVSNKTNDDTDADKLVTQSWENGIVPSSVPSQDHKLFPPPPKPKPQPVVKKTNTRPKRTPGPAVEGKVTPATKRKAGARDSEELSDSDDLGDKGRKRRRKAPVETPVPVGRHLKATSAHPDDESNADTVALDAPRVFALWSADSHYYPGYISGPASSGGRYLVHFDDGTKENVLLENMRRGVLRVGDDVISKESNRSCKVVGLVDDDKNAVVILARGQKKTAKIANICLAHRTVASPEWEDRKLAPVDFAAQVKMAGKMRPSPTPSRLSVPLVALKAGVPGMLEGDAFVITTCPAEKTANPKLGDKVELKKLIQKHGGEVVDEFSSVLEVSGQPSMQNNRWIYKADGVRWKDDSAIQRLWLIADDASQTGKYLTALALGVPCISAEWMYQCDRKNTLMEWDRFLLPQGTSQALKARLSQQVDLDWGNSPHHLTDIMANQIPAKIFSGLSLLCVGSDMVSQVRATGKRRQNADVQETVNIVPRIILCMGAKVVEAVTDPRYASQPLSEYGYIVVREDDVCSKYPQLRGAGRVVSWSWVKECLISSRLLPIPTPEVEEVDEEASQEV